MICSQSAVQAHRRISQNELYMAPPYGIPLSGRFFGPTSTMEESPVLPTFGCTRQASHTSSIGLDLHSDIGLLSPIPDSPVFEEGPTPAASPRLSLSTPAEQQVLPRGQSRSRSRSRESRISRASMRSREKHAIFYENKVSSNESRTTSLDTHQTGADNRQKTKGVKPTKTKKTKTTKCSDNKEAQDENAQLYNCCCIS